MKIVDIKDLPNTVNAWGFGGATNKQKIFMENKDIWYTGTAHYRHMKPHKYIRLVRDDVEILDNILNQSAIGYINKYYRTHS